MADLILEIVEGNEAGMEIPLGEPVELGRDPTLAGALADDQVSRRHARLVPSGDGVLVEDLGSTNGTYANDEPVEGVRELTVGDRIRVGLTVLELRTRQEATVSGSAVAPGPPVTRIGADVLQPAGERELAPVQAEPATPPSLRVDEREPGFIQASAVQAGLAKGRGRADGGGAGTAPGPTSADALAHLVDTRVKRQTGVAAFAVLAVAALAVAIFFGAR